MKERTRMAAKQLNDLIRHAALVPWDSRAPQFMRTTGWATNYGDLFAESYDTTVPETQILDVALNGGRAILTGRAGDGKTWLMRRIFQQALARKYLPIFIDLKKWTGADYEEWDDWTRLGAGDGADFLLQRFGHPSLSAMELDRIHPSVKKLLLVDGLSEISASVGSQILELVDELVRDQINVSALVADRLTRRAPPNPSRWSYGYLLPMSAEDIRSISPGISMDGDIELLRSPFFLDAAIRFGVRHVRRSDASAAYLNARIALNEPALERVAMAAFDAYSRQRSRVFDFDQFSAIAGREISQALVEAGVIEQTGKEGGYFFVHHILHDFLAAKYFSSLSSDKWNAENFSILSFGSSSFDAIELSFEQIAPPNADIFLQKLYDWNLYAAGYALVHLTPSSAWVGVEVRSMILAMLAEKRFDKLLSTQVRAADILSLIRLDEAHTLRKSQSLLDVFLWLDEVVSTAEWFNRWRGVFRIAPNDEIAIDLLHEICAPDSIIGWTLANVAKRAQLPGDGIEALVEWLSAADTSATVRWRIVHVLGAYPCPISFSALYRRLDEDPSEDVRYGSIRSIVEAASVADPQTRTHVAAELCRRAARINGSRRIYSELRASLLLDPRQTPTDWFYFSSNVIRGQFVEADDINLRDFWRTCYAETEALHKILLSDNDRLVGAENG